MDYLRDVAWVARKRNDALADLDSDVAPVFLQPFTTINLLCAENIKSAPA